MKKLTGYSPSRLRDSLLLVSMAAATSPAFAQLEKAKSLLSTVQAWILGIGVVLTTIALMFVGFKMMFHAAQWKDVAPVFWGAVIVGAASGVATMLVG